MIWTTWSSRTLEATAIVIALAGLIMHNFIMASAGVFIVVALWLGYFLSQRAFQTLRLQWTHTRYTLEPDEKFVWAADISNPLPVAAGQIRLRQEIPSGIIAVSGRVDARFSLGPRRKARVEVAMQARDRGRWTYAPCELSQLDLWGWSESSMQCPSALTVTVWPRRIDFPQEMWVAARQAGEAKGQYWDEPDPSLYQGIRPYRPGDALKWVHPFASMRTGEMMIKEVERTRDFHVDVVCHPVTSLDPWYGIDRAAVENCFVLSASAVQSALSMDIHCGLTITCPLPGAGHGLTLAPQLGTNTLAEYLTDLAWAYPSGALSGNAQNLLAEILRRGDNPGLILLVSPIWDPSLTVWLQQLAIHGHMIGWLTGQDSGGDPDGVDILWVWTKERGIYAQHVSRGHRSVVDLDGALAE